MRALSILMISASAVATAACGSSSNVAPVVYGTQPQSTGASRIYNSPRDHLARNANYNGAQQARNYAPAKIDNAYTRPAPITPITRTVFEDEPEATSRPIYLAAQQPAAAQPVRQKTIAAAPATVTVGPGDTVYAIARRTGASPQSIIALNRLRAPYTLEIGDQLRVPGAQPHAQAQAQQSPTRQVVSRDLMHSVRPGETLYGLSRATGVSVQAIAQANQMRAPYSLYVGQRVLIPGAKTGAMATLSAPPKPEAVHVETPTGGVANLAREVSYSRPELPPAPEPARFFEWPVKGAVIGKYGDGELGKKNDGINIAAPVGTPVRAAAAGEVVYRGSELEGYGNLLLIKHDDGYVTAYAHNDAMLVRKGQKVNQGQVIAKVGQTGSAPEPQLHFEIRQNLKSIDPLAFLGS